MAKTPRLAFDPDLEVYTGKMSLGKARVDVTAEAADERALKLLRQAIQRVGDDWPERHARLSLLVEEELRATGRLTADRQVVPEQIVPFSLGLHAAPEGEISYSVGYDVDAVLADDEYVDVEEEINGDWSHCEVRSTE